MTKQLLEPGFLLIHGNRAEELCAVAIQWLTQNPLPPLEPEVILVQSAGVAQWLQQKIAYAGIAAGLDFVLPASFVWRAYKTVLASDEIPDQALLDKNKLIWQLFRLLDTDFDENSAISNFLTDGSIEKRYQLAQHLASLYDQYQVYRADWLSHWEQNENIVINNQNRSIELDENQLWQSALWRNILVDTKSAHGNVWGRSKIHNQFMDKILANDDLSDYSGLPSRVLVFGVSTMPKQILETLVALSSQIQVLVFINNPCEHYWGDIQGEYEILRSSLKRHQKKPNSPIISSVDDLHNNVQPLLASWGRQGRDFIAMLDDFDTPDRRQKSIDLFSSIERKIDIFTPLKGNNLLEQIQDDIRDLRPVSESKNWPVLSDKSIQFHITYSKQRELEVLHDQLLAEFARDKDLKPSDVIVMVPDITAYAAHIEAVFGLYDSDDYRHLPFSIADRGQRNIDPLVVALEKLLKLPNLRFGAKEILDLLEVPALRKRFKLEPDHLSLISFWVEQSNVRWGLDGKHKSTYVPSLTDNYNTWEFGLNRMLLGYATGATDSTWQDIYPYTEPGGMQANALGYLTNYIATLKKYQQVLADDNTPADWVEILGKLLDDFFMPDQPQDESTILRFRQVLQDWLDVCIDTQYESELPIDIVANYCLDQLDQLHYAPRFFAGAITFATLMPMRAIPFKHICLLGMQDGEFPRIHNPDDFDLMSLYPRAGDRSRREDDRYLFLEALLSAREKFYISWVGIDINDSSDQPPSVLVAQLIDHINAAWKTDDGQSDAADFLTTRHPLQPFSKKYFWHNAADDKHFTYANEWQNTSANLHKPNLNQLLTEQNTFNVSNLVRFIRNPIQYFYHYALGVYFYDSVTDLDEDESFELDGLGKWQIKNDILRIVEKTSDRSAINEYKHNLIKKGVLPFGNTADFMFQDVYTTVTPVIEVFDSVIEQYPHKLPGFNIDTTLANGVVINGLLNGIYTDNNNNYKRLVLSASNAVEAKKNPTYKYKHIAPVWAEHIALNYMLKPTETILATPKGIVSFEPIEKPEAADIWANLWQCFNAGINQSLAVDPDLSYMWLNQGENIEDKLIDAFNEKLAHDLYFAHAFKNFNDFYVVGHFPNWSELLYGEIRSRLKSHKIGEW